MSFFDDRPTLSLSRALRRYWVAFAILAAEPVIAQLLPLTLPGVTGPRALTAVPAFLVGLYPAAFGSAPASYWFSACGAWFGCALVVMASSHVGLAS